MDLNEAGLVKEKHKNVRGSLSIRGGFSHDSKLIILAKIPEVIICIWNNYLKLGNDDVYSI